MLGLKLRRLRASQRTVLGQEERDLVAHASSLQEAFVQLRDWVEETAVRLEDRMGTAERRIDGCVAYSSLVRYDAWGEMSGHQSSSMALLDSHRSGVVVSSILHRDQARVYVKQVREGESEHRALARGAAGHRRRDGRHARLMRVGYLGPAGTYSEEALRSSAPAGVEEVPFPTIYDAVMAVHEGGVEQAVVPIENALEGAVAITLDTLALEATDVRIVAEVVHPIHHCVVAARELELADVARVVSHPQATAQCARFLRERLPHAERVLAPSTAEAVLSLRDSAEPAVALGSRLAAELYGCRVLEADVEDHPDNATRFVWLGREASSRRRRRPRPPSSSGAAATSRPAGWSTGCASCPTAR